MAKKTVASAKAGKGRDFTKVIRMDRSPKTGAYVFTQEIIPNDRVKEFFAKK